MFVDSKGEILVLLRRETIPMIRSMARRVETVNTGTTIEGETPVREVSFPLNFSLF